MWLSVPNSYQEIQLGIDSTLVLEDSLFEATLQCRDRAEKRRAVAESERVANLPVGIQPFASSFHPLWTPRISRVRLSYLVLPFLNLIIVVPWYAAR